MKYVYMKINVSLGEICRASGYLFIRTIQMQMPMRKRSWVRMKMRKRMRTAKQLQRTTHWMMRRTGASIPRW